MQKQEIIQEIVDLQRRAERARRTAELDVWMSLPLTMAQLKCLFFIANNKVTSPGEMAQALKVTPTNITGIIDRLVKQGLVSRNENPDNRRMLLIKNTDKGEQIVAKLRERRWGYTAEILKGMSLDDLKALNQGLKALVELAEAKGIGKVEEKTA